MELDPPPLMKVNKYTDINRTIKWENSGVPIGLSVNGCNYANDTFFIRRTSRGIMTHFQDKFIHLPIHRGPPHLPATNYVRH
nr:hypothetical protein Itr_chr09CG02680 [Ipomoea trifida]